MISCDSEHMCVGRYNDGSLRTRVKIATVESIVDGALERTSDGRVREVFFYIYFHICITFKIIYFIFIIIFLLFICIFVFFFRNKNEAPGGTDFEEQEGAVRGDSVSSRQSFKPGPLLRFVRP